MTRQLLMVLVVSCPCALAEPPKKDHDLLQGRWVMAALEVNGKLVPEERLRDAFLEIKGDKYITTTKNRSIETRFTLDPSKKPKTIDMVFTDGEKKGKVHKGIYELTGDTLKICRGLEANQERPTELATWPGTNVFLVTWKRVK